MSKRTINTWKPRKVTIQCERGQRIVNANVLGSMAMHPIRGGNLWRLTHVKTGRAVKDFPRWQDARAVAEALSTVGGLNTANVGRVRRLVAGVIGA